MLVLRVRRQLVKLFLRQLLWMMIRLLHEAMAMRVVGVGVL